MNHKTITRAYKYLTYSKMFKNIKLISCSLKHKLKIPDRDCLGILGYNCWEWLACDIASCAFNQLLSIGIHLNYT